MKKLKIAIMGATSHVAKGLVNNFLQSREKTLLYLYSRSSQKIYEFLNTINKTVNDNIVVGEGYQAFSEFTYDVIINCIGVGTLNKFQGDYSKFFTIIERYDNLALEYLFNKNSSALYISISSGAVYGRGLSGPARENTANCIKVNCVNETDYYGIARIYAEAKHRSLKELKIVDLRLFSYFSRFIDLTDNYFITEVINSVIKKKTLLIDRYNIIRDYTHPDDLFSVVLKCMKIGKINSAFDMISARPVEKREILDFFSSKYGLKYEARRLDNKLAATGFKKIYYSTYNKLKKLGHEPKFSSLDAIKQESKYLLTN